jgi:hypothetical protein
MPNSSPRARPPRKHPRTLLWAILLAVVPSGVALWAGPCIVDTDLRKVVFAGAGTLFFGGFLGGILKLFLDEILASKRRRDDAASFVTNVLADLKSVYDRVARARIVIPAHQSVKTYGDEMRDLINARVQLRNVVRALEWRSDGVTDDVRREIIRRVEQMEDYLRTLNSEFVEKYKALSDQQRGYEERAKIVLERFAKDETLKPPTLPGFVWDSLSSLTQLSDFIGSGAIYKKAFEDPLDYASEQLRNELARILRASSAAV